MGSMIGPIDLNEIYGKNEARQCVIRLVEYSYKARL